MEWGFGFGPRPPVATKRLSVDDLGRVVYRYRRPFRNGSTHVVLEPLDIIARLAALVPRPRLNLTRIHSAGGIEVTVLAKPKKWPSEAIVRVFAPNSTHRSGEAVMSAMIPWGKIDGPRDWQ